MINIQLTKGRKPMATTRLARVHFTMHLVSSAMDAHKVIVLRSNKLWITLEALFCVLNTWISFNESLFDGWHTSLPNLSHLGVKVEDYVLESEDA